MSAQENETYRLSPVPRNAFLTAVYNRYGRKLYSYALYSWKLDEDIAWELIYKTLYRVADTRAGYTFATEEKFASFIFRIFINYLRNHYRDHKADREVIFSAIGQADTGIPRQEEETLKSSRRQALDELLDGMQDWERMLLLMRSEGRAYAEIAQYIDKPEDQLKVYYQRLKEKIAKKLNEGRNGTY